MFKLSSPARVLPLLAMAVAGSSALLPATATAAGGAYYRAELAKPAPTGKFVARDIVWSCEGTNCVGARGSSRPQIMCSSLVKKAGEVKAFSIDGKAFEAEELARCNAAS